MTEKLYYDGEEIEIRAVTPQEIADLQEAIRQTPIDSKVEYLATVIRTRELINVSIRDIEIAKS